MLTTSFDSRIYSNLFGTESMKCIWSDTQLVQSWLDTEVALAQVQAELGLIPHEAAEAIEQCATVDNIDWDKLQRRTEEVGMPIKPVVEQIASVGGEVVARYLHWGATTQDILDTGQALRLKSTLDLLDSGLRQYLRALVEMANRYRLTPMVARTNSQDAAPTSWGLHVSGYAAEVVRHLERLQEIRPRVCMGMFGGAVGTLAAGGDDAIQVRNGLMAKLGLTEPTGAWNASQDGIAEYLQWTGLIHGTLARMARDIETMGRTSVGELQEGEGRGESSTMPHKTNPRASNMLQTYARLGRMYCSGALDLMDQIDVRAASMRATAWTILPEASMVLSAALERAERLVTHLVVHDQRMLENFSHSRQFVMSEAVMMRLAQAVGRDQAYLLVKEAVSSEGREGATFGELLTRDSALEHT